MTVDADLLIHEKALRNCRISIGLEHVPLWPSQSVDRKAEVEAELSGATCAELRPYSQEAHPFGGRFGVCAGCARVESKALTSTVHRINRGLAFASGAVLRVEGLGHAERRRAAGLTSETRGRSSLPGLRVISLSLCLFVKCKHDELASFQLHLISASHISGWPWLTWGTAVQLWSYRSACALDRDVGLPDEACLASSMPWSHCNIHPPASM